MYTLEQAHSLISEPELSRSVVITDATQPDNPIVYVTRTFLDATGYGEADVIGRNPRFLQGPETDPGDLARIRAALAAERPIHVTLRNHRKDGTAFWHDIRIRPSYSASGDLEHFIAVQRIVDGS